MRIIYIALLSLLISSCSLLGVHLKVENPKRDGKYPKFSETTKILGTLNSKYRTCFDATYYDLDVLIDEKNKFLKGTVIMNATAVTDFDTLQLDLYPNMKVKSIGFFSHSSSQENQNIFIIPNYTRKYGAIFIQIKQKTGDRFKIKIEYEGSPQVAKKPPWDGGFVWKKDKQNNPWIGVACESEGASLWWPCKDVTNDEPDSVSISITASKNLVSVSNGQLKAKIEKEELATYKWFVSYPINLYNVTIYIGNFKLISDSLKNPFTGKILPINHYVLAPNYDIAKKHFTQAKEQVAFFEKTFGEYPWRKDGYKLVESPYEGMEHQSAIAYGNGYKNGYQPFDYIILHESAHEWWGNAITAADLADVWLQEGFATYSEALYVENTQGKNAYLRYMYYYRIFIENKYPIIGPENKRYFDYRNSDCYQKGAWVLHTLRSTINDDYLFFDIIKTFYEKYKLKTTCTKDFISVVNEKTNTDYNWFFNQYLYSRKAPMLEYFWDGKDFFFKWSDVLPDFKMPAEIILDNTVKVNLKPSAKIQKVAISKEAYKEISFNDAYLLYGLKENKKLKKKFSSGQSLINQSW